MAGMTTAEIAKERAYIQAGYIKDAQGIWKKPSGAAISTGITKTPIPAAPKVAGIGQITGFTGTGERPKIPTGVKEVGSATWKGVKEMFGSVPTVFAGRGIAEAEAATPQNPFLPTPTRELPVQTTSQKSSKKVVGKVAGIDVPFVPTPLLMPGDEVKKITTTPESDAWLAGQQPEIPPMPTVTPQVTAEMVPATATPTPTKTMGFGDWFSSLNAGQKGALSKSLMTAGLTMLATEPRRVPYSNAEMLGRAGLAGIGAYDTEIAKEAAGREAERKAGIEGRITRATEGKAWADMSEKFTNVDEWLRNPETPLISRTTGKARETYKGDPYLKNGKWYVPYLFKDDGTLANELPTTATGALGYAPRGGEGGKADDRAAFIRAAYQTALKESDGDTVTADTVASDAGRTFDALQKGEAYTSPVLEKLPWWKDWLGATPNVISAGGWGKSSQREPVKFR